MEEACLMAVGMEHPDGPARVHHAVITDVHIEATDLPFIRRHLLVDDTLVIPFPVGVYDPLPAA